MFLQPSEQRKDTEVPLSCSPSTDKFRCWLHLFFPECEWSYVTQDVTERMMATWERNYVTVTAVT